MGVFLLIFLQSNPVKSQSEVWSLGDKTFSFIQYNSIGNLPIGNPNTIITNYPYLANNILSAQKFVYNGEKPVFSQNVIYDEYGAVRCFIIDGNVYDHEGILLGNGVWNLTDFSGYSYFLPEGNTETTIVPVPGKCNSYYVIAATYADEIGYSSDLTQRDISPTATIYYYEINFNEYSFDYNDRKGQVSSPIQLSGHVQDCGSIHLAATKPVNDSEERYLYISTCGDLRKCLVSNNGITQTYSSPVLDFGFNYDDNTRSEMEVIEHNNLYLVAKSLEYDKFWSPFTPSNFFQYVEVREMRGSDGEGEFPTSDGRRIFYINFELYPSTDYHITGLEFSPSGNVLYVATQEPPYLWYSDITSLSFPPANTSGSPNLYGGLFSPVSALTPFTVDADYQGSQIELGKDGNMYMYAGKDNMLAISNLDDLANGPTINYISLNLDNPASIGTDIHAPGDFYFCHLLNDQIDGENYSSFNAATPECCSESIVYNLKDNDNTAEYEIVNNTIWNNNSAPWGSGDGLVEKDIIVESGAKLTINGRTLKFSKDAKLIVKKGASLVLNNATLTSVDCDGIMWPGVEVYGTQGVAHTTQFNSAYGTVLLQNNSVISNAINGITTCPRSGNTLNLTQSGGYINANTSSFINNRIDVDLTPHIHSGFPTLPPAEISKSIFRNCTFRTTDDLKDGSVIESHAKLTQVRGVKFIANTFINSDNSNPIITDRGTGITSVDSKFYVTYSCSSPQLQGNPCPEQNRIGNTFENLHYGINAQAGNLLNNMVVEHSKFVNTHRGIRMIGMLGAKIDENNFSVGAVSPGTNIQSHGVYMEKCSKYFVQNNTFNTNYNGDYGIITVGFDQAQNEQLVNNEIRNNIFTGLKYGATSSKINFSSNTTSGLETGLQYLCNEFYNSEYVDVQVPSGGIHNGQGGCDISSQINIDFQPANNTFTVPVPPAKHFSIIDGTLFPNGVLHPTYYHHALNNLSSFDIIPDNNSSSVFNNTDCQNATFPMLKSVVCSEREYTRLSTGRLFENIFLTKNKIEEYYKLIDNNNSNGLLTAITSQSSGQVKNLLMDASPYLSDKVLLNYISSNPPVGHLLQILLANSPVSDEVMEAINSVNLPNGIRNQINAEQTGISPREELMQSISFTYFTKDGYSDEIFRRFLNDTISNKLDSLDYLMLFDPSVENNHIRIAIKVQQTNYIGAQSLITDLRASGTANENFLKLMESLIIIYQCQDKVYRLNWDIPLKNEIENIATSTSGGRECKNAGALLELLKIFTQAELYEVININDVRSLFDFQEGTTGVQKFTIYPNPGTDFMNIQTTSINENLCVYLYDLSGKLIFSEQVTNTDYFLLDVSGYAKGMYLIQLNTDHGNNEVQKLIVE